METLLQDMRYEIRTLRQAPGFTVVAVMTLALGIGANTAIFSVVDAVLLRGLPLQRPGQIVRLQEFHQRVANVTGATFHDVRERNHVFSQVAVYRIFSQNLSDTRQGAPPEQIDAAFVSQDFLPLLAVTPLLGPGFTPEQFQEHAERVVILSYGLWQHHFGSDRQIIGKVITLHGHPHVVSGVMPIGFSFPEAVEAWVPLTYDLTLPQNRRAHLFTTLARVRPGVSMEAVQSDLQAISVQVQQENHDLDPGFTLHADRLQNNLVSSVRPTLLILLGAVAFVLLIACANLANLLLSRSISRQREIAVRTALGATQFQLARQLLTESTLLGVLGGAAGGILGLASVKALYTAYPGAMPGLPTPGTNWRVLVFVFAVSWLASTLSGAIPAIQSSRLNLHEQLVEIGRSTGSATRQRFRSFLVITELALATILLAAAGLLIRSLILLQQVDPGFNSSHLAVARLLLPESQYPELSQRVQFVNSVLERLRALPGVQSVAAAGTLPFEPVPETDIELEGHVYAPGSEPEVEILTATPEYFRTMGIRLLAGRGFTPQDLPSTPTALVINQTMARRFWPEESAPGKRVVMKDWGPPLPGQIAGVVSDVKQDSLETDSQPAIYYSYAQFPEGTLTTYVIVRSAPDPLSFAAAIRDQIWSVDRDQPVTVVPMEQIVSGSLERRRFVLILLGSFAALALLLAVLGVYGVVAYSVGQRTHEFGIRMALGAQRSQLLLMVLTQSVRNLMAGLAIGVAGASIVTRLMQSLLFGIGAADPLTFSLMALILMLSSLMASYLPARRAAAVDPMITLRNE
jgi:putative ABC transport system permease protein